MKYCPFILFLSSMILLSTSCVKDKIVEDPSNVDYSSDEYITRTLSCSEGRLKGLFSLSDSTQVYFSQGNLQYIPATGEFSFADEQYLCLGKSAGNVLFAENRSATTLPIDLFAWGTSGYDNTESDPLAINYQPWAYASTITLENESNPYGYGPSVTSNSPSLIYNSSKYDWGLYNSITNGGNKVGCWRVPTQREWNYLFNERADAMLLYGLATVADVKGLVLLPDGKVCTDGSFVSRSEGAKKYESNVYTAEQWENLQMLGYVFLPAGGFCKNSEIKRVEDYGTYQSSSYSTAEHSFHVCFQQDDKTIDVCARPRCIGRSVRLIQDVK